MNGVVDEEFGEECDLVFEEVYRANHNRIRHLCRRYLYDPRDVEEAVQDVFIRAYLALPKFCSEADVARWLTSVAINRSIDVVRRTRRVGRREIALLPTDVYRDGTSGPDDTVVHSMSVIEVLRQIPDDHARALELRVLHGASHVEVGRALGRSPRQAKALLYRARRSFKRVWAA